MYTYIELWKAKQSWLDLSQEERGNYMDALGPAIQQMIENGVQILSWGVNESPVNRGEYDYFGVWTFPNEESTKNFEKLVEGAGWYNYFDQVNIAGKADNPQNIIGHMIGL